MSESKGEQLAMRSLFLSLLNYFRSIVGEIGRGKEQREEKKPLKVGGVGGLMGGVSAEDDTKVDPPASKRRKLVPKSVVTVKFEAGSGKQKGEGPPSDSWSWRKYGQKPIKGSPHPRGYYKCSTFKGCPAKKQVERCRTDASLIIITYSSNHNHPGPDLSSTIINNNTTTITTTTPTLQSSSEEESKCIEDITKQDPAMEETVVQEGHDHLSILFDEEGPLPYPHRVASSLPPKLSEENDFFDELEELPIISSSLSSLVRSSLFDERILLLPS
ncbi:uncharacterized protein [Typha angustifolia]|uniref:uncharacterized protein isoform X2 n=1 Tax=Typha angustifolia TaxID=59011 RepID=UPI003C2BE842